jgi:SAM-dependent methyltransferase
MGAQPELVLPIDYDTELKMHNEVLRRAYGIRRDDRVLDIGCGAGATTRDAARLAAEGSALGVDISAPMVERARELARAEGLGNVTFECADAQVHPFGSETFEIAISRFGTMFFPDPHAAFANIRQALRPAGRLVMMVWQSHDRNEWSVAIQKAVPGDEGTPTSRPNADPFSLGDPPTVESILGLAGFGEITFTDVHEPVYYGPDLATALEWVSAFTCVGDALKALDPDSAARALGRLRGTLAEHASSRGVWFDSRAWIVKARVS